MLKRLINYTTRASIVYGNFDSWCNTVTRFEAKAQGKDIY